MRSAKPGMVAGLLAAAVLWPAAPGTALAPVSARETATPAPSVFCGTDAASGLGVSADRAGSCGVALQVASAYTRILHRTRGAPAELRAAGATWVCRERQGDPNPYQECRDTGGSGRRITLTS
ncbi:hypothetical protein [Streptomyces sp. NPDC007369]|uniref:hypothetical protein n=1 Tax=Streptomyces sp. NPDC007369 TaxID=3154589 RepID=UPI0033C70E63